MAFGRALRRQARGAIAPLLFSALTGYFLWSATQGEHGLHAYVQRQADLRAAVAEQGLATADLALWQKRIAGLRNSNLDEDALDERARAMLNLAEPADLVVTLKPSERIF